jgi:hypothetical protein
MQDEKLVRGIHRRQQLEVEPDLADILITDRLFLVVLHLYLVAVPQQSECLAWLLADSSEIKVVVTGSSSLTGPMVLRTVPTTNLANASQSAHLSCAAGSRNNIRRILSEISKCSKISCAGWLAANTSLR